VNPDVARQTWKTLEPVHAMVYFAPEPQEEYAALGLDSSQNRAVGYFPARAAAMGAVTWPTVQATFFNFSSLAVQFGLAGVWDLVTPEQVLAARYRGADRALRRLCGPLLDDGDGLEEAVALAREATTACTPYGRPLYAAHAGLPWPQEPHLQLWHAITLLREFRGDGHIAVLVTEQVTGLEAAVLHVALGDTWSRKALQATRAYSDEEWDAAVAGLAAGGWLHPDGTMTDQGRARREAIEERTDVLALAPWERIGEDGAARLRDLVRPLSKAVTAAGTFGPIGPSL
jgi:hypothetical protein